MSIYTRGTRALRVVPNNPGQWSQPSPPDLPRKTPLATPGMPWISVTLFCTKYSSQVALRLEPLQKRRQSAVVTVPLLTTCILAQVSKLRFASVRFPSRQTLEQGEDRAPFYHSSRPTQWEAQRLPCYCRGHMSGASIKPDSNSLGTDLSYKPSTNQGCLPPAWGNSFWKEGGHILHKDGKPTALGVSLHPGLLSSLSRTMAALVSPRPTNHLTPGLVHTRSLAITLVTLVKPPQFHKRTRASPSEGFL